MRDIIIGNPSVASEIKEEVYPIVIEDCETTIFLTMRTSKFFYPAGTQITKRTAEGYHLSGKRTDLTITQCLGFVDAAMRQLQAEPGGNIKRIFDSAGMGG